jgi:proline iminopeptidase
MDSGQTGASTHREFMECALMIFMNFKRQTAGWRRRRHAAAWNPTSIAAMLSTAPAPLGDSPLFAPIEPYASAHLDVGDGHRLYVEQCGNPDGMPMVYLHGGPGSGCSVRHRQFFDPARCRVVLFDQRGCGRSEPRGALTHNHTDALVQDLETVRLHLGFARWLVVGGSWGAGLGLAYALAHPDACLGLVLRGVFLGRDADIEGFFAGGPALQGLHAGLHGPDAEAALACALVWEAWEQSVAQQRAVTPRRLHCADADAARLVDKYRVQSHFLVHRCFREGAGFLPPVGNLAGLPIAILHGGNDTVCLPQAALDLHRRQPGSHLQWVAGGGHDPFEAGNAAALVATIGHFATHGHFAP